jgi:coatomer subunit beta
MDIVTSRNVDEVVSILKREVAKTAEENPNAVESKGAIYRGMLIRAIHGCAVKFPQVAENVVHVLMDFLSSDSGMKVIVFVRSIVEQYPPLRTSILSKLRASLDQVNNPSIMCVCLWILGEYCETATSLRETFSEILDQIGEASFILNNEDKKAQEKAMALAAAGPKMVTKNVVLADGTYATQTVYTEVKKVFDTTPSLRKLLIGGDVFLGSVVASCLTKLCLRAIDFSTEISPTDLKKMNMDTLLVLCAIVKMAETSDLPQKSCLADCVDRITMCCRALLDPQAQLTLKHTLLDKGKSTFASFLKSLKEKDGKDSKKKDDKGTASVQADDLIHFRHLRSTTVSGGDIDLDDGSDLARATGFEDGGSLLNNELRHVYQLSGFSDPVYAEAFVTVRDYDISVEILLINRTPNTLSNLSVELNTMGDMKIVERPPSLTIGPLDEATTRASIKVSSTETGHIFGTICYEDASTKEKYYINLNSIHMDIMDYIRPASCSDEMFR